MGRRGARRWLGDTAPTMSAGLGNFGSRREFRHGRITARDWATSAFAVARDWLNHCVGLRDWRHGYGVWPRARTDCSGVANRSGKFDSRRTFLRRCAAVRLGYGGAVGGVARSRGMPRLTELDHLVQSERHSDGEPLVDAAGAAGADGFVLASQRG